MSDIGPLVCCVSWCELVELWARVGGSPVWVRALLCVKGEG